MLVYKFLTAHFALKSLYEKRLKISRLYDLNDPFELIPYDLSDKIQRQALHATRDRLTVTRGILCFSTNWHDPVIWAHYSDKHRGICLGFEVPDDKCKPVNYVLDRLPFPEETALSVEHAEAMLFTKFMNWQYEQEVRIWVDLTDEEDGLYFKDFDSELKLAEVIVGAECTVPRSAIERALLPSSDGITLIRARPGFTKFQIVTDQRGLK